MKKMSKTLILLMVLLIIFIIFGWFLVIRKNKEYFETEESEIKNPSFHILIATMGKDSIFNLLEKLKEQLNKEDYLCSSIYCI
jgi:uncharacterized protein YneF (UPF0154 family)